MTSLSNTSNCGHWWCITAEFFPSFWKGESGQTHNPNQHVFSFWKREMGPPSTHIATTKSTCCFCFSIGKPAICNNQPVAFIFLPFWKGEGGSNWKFIMFVSEGFPGACNDATAVKYIELVNQLCDGMHFCHNLSTRSLHQMESGARLLSHLQWWIFVVAMSCLSNEGCIGPACT